MKLEELFSSLKTSTRFLSRVKLVESLDELADRLLSEGLDELADAEAARDAARADVETVKTELGRVWDAKHDLADRVAAMDRVNATLRGELADAEARRLLAAARHADELATEREKLATVADHLDTLGSIGRGMKAEIARGSAETVSRSPADHG